MKAKRVCISVDPIFRKWLRMESTRNNMNMTDFSRHLASSRNKDIEFDINIGIKNEKTKQKKEKFFW